MESWFQIEKVDEDSYVIREPRHWEESNCYVLIGSERALMIDTGMGISDIRKEVERLTDVDVIAVATHVHWDHIGGHGEFPQFYVHEAEQAWIEERFPLPLEVVKKQFQSGPSTLPESFHLDDYSLFRGKAKRILKDGDWIDLGNRRIQVIHTPGHSPGHMCFYEEERSTLYTGDLVYEGKLYANYPSTDPQAFLASLKKISELQPKRLLPAHHTWRIEPKLLTDIQEAFEGLDRQGILCHGSGSFDYDSFCIRI